MRQRWITLVSLYIVAVGSANAAVGVASHLTGSPEAKTAGESWRPIKFLQRLDAGDTIRCGPGDDVTIVLFDGGTRFRVAPGANAVVQAGTVQGAVKAANLRGPSMQVAKSMAGSRADAFIARPAESHQRLYPQFPGWIVEGDRHFQWLAVPGAATYSFTLFDSHDDVVWSVRTADVSADYPADLPYPTLQKTYVWRLSPFGKSGKPVPGARWGMVTFLSKTDADELAAEAKQISDQASAPDGDATDLVMLAELYRSYGVLEKTLETLEGPRLANQPGIRDAQDQVYAQVSRYAQLLRPDHAAAPSSPSPSAPGDAASSTSTTAPGASGP
jgi:hypothetical protein